MDSIPPSSLQILSQILPLFGILLLNFETFTNFWSQFRKFLLQLPPSNPSPPKPNPTSSTFLAFFRKFNLALLSMDSSDPPPPSPKIENPIKTLDDESSPTAPIRTLVAHSLALSSPIRQIQHESPLVTPSSADNEYRPSQIPSDDNNKSYIPSFEYLSDDDDHKMEPPEPFSWSYLKNEPTGVVCIPI